MCLLALNGIVHAVQINWLEMECIT